MDIELRVRHLAKHFLKKNAKMPTMVVTNAQAQIHSFFFKENTFFIAKTHMPISDSYINYYTILIYSKINMSFFPFFPKWHRYSEPVEGAKPWNFDLIWVNLEADVGFCLMQSVHVAASWQQQTFLLLENGFKYQ